MERQLRVEVEKRLGTEKLLAEAHSAVAHLQEALVDRSAEAEDAGRRLVLLEEELQDVDQEDRERDAELRLTKDELAMVTTEMARQAHRMAQRERTREEREEKLSWREEEIREQEESLEAERCAMADTLEEVEQRLESALSPSAAFRDDRDDDREAPSMKQGLSLVEGPHARRNRTDQPHRLRARAGSTKRIKYNGQVAKQRVFVFPNDGGVETEPQAVVIDDWESLLSGATKKLGLAWGARRVFSLDGAPITSIRDEVPVTPPFADMCCPEPLVSAFEVDPEMDLVISSGEAFQPRSRAQYSQTPRRSELHSSLEQLQLAQRRLGEAREAIQHRPREGPHRHQRFGPSLGQTVDATSLPRRDTTPPRHRSNRQKTSPSETGSVPKTVAARSGRYHVWANDGGRSQQRCIVVVNSSAGLLKDASYKLGLRSMATRLFTVAGEEITGESLSQIPEAWGLVVTEGEPFQRRVEF